MIADGAATVELAYRNLAEIPEELLTNCDSIGALDLSGNPGIRLHGAISRFKNVRKLVLNDCAIFSLPNDISDITELEELVLRENNFSDGLNRPVGRLRTLKKLDLGSCAMESVPDWLGDLDMLEELVLRGNNFSIGLNPAVARLHSLRKLDLDSCAMKSVPDRLKDLEVLEELVLRGNNFSNGLNPSVGQLHALRKLDISVCQLSNVPDQLGYLKALEELVLRENSFSDVLNPAVGQLRALRKLDLDSCAMESLPDCLGDLEVLEELVLRGNNFSDGLNPAVGRLLALTYLNLGWCRLKSLPDSLGDLKVLSILMLNNNYLEEYPPCLLRMMKLEELDVANYWDYGMEGEGNRIKRLPVELAFTRLRRFAFDGNPITEPPAEIWTQGLDAIKSYMQALIPGGMLTHAHTVNMTDTEGDNAQCSELLRRLNKVTPQLVSGLDRHSVAKIVDELLAARDGYGLITVDHRQEIGAESTDSGKVRKLLHIISARGDEAIKLLAEALNCDGVQRPDLAKLILESPL